ncbi:ABC transporter ATP-binding protein [Actinosynnema pretiosum subsp. pretiosum]|uniref:ABC transporter related n=2 Tax=Actinosynnema TaxID=40566 RepID=C6WL83_ACTMD|nr:ABC transporter ATP-binding protein [Actinosynnema mirum]ACU36436.1 ABC transporter related [Actinosynnema mirum DSM 43827]AXX29885.1 Lipid A export ATP-binding/permease protein MsbA [Actinosynnema pretiosum subsp. pretiosum]QUF05913.1 ABC transporter ATP-binding protein [Actinosynnema pretiosum subsp. pretiosum]
MTAPTPGALRVLLAYARPHRGVLLASLALVLVASATGLAQPLVARDVLSGLGGDGGVLGPVLLLAALVVVGALLTGLQSWWQQRTAERVVREVRRDLVHRLIRLRVPELDRRPPGDLAARVTADSTLLQNAATEGLVMVANGLITALGAVVIMGVLHAGLLAVTLGVLLTVALLLLVVLPRIRAAVARAQSSVGAIGAALDRVLGAARTVKANGAEARETERANAAVESAYLAGLRGARHVAVVKVLTGVAVQGAFLAVLGVGGALVAAGGLTAPDLIAFLLYVFSLAAPLAALVGGLSALQQGLGAVGRIHEVAAMPVEDDVDLPVPETTRTAPPSVEFRDVGFAHPGRAQALRGVSFTADPGARTALVGPSGAGKSTSFALLQRFVEPDSGTILLDGVDITTIPRAHLRATIAHVEQDAPVLAGTLRENLLYAEPNATDAEVDRVLRVTMLKSFVDDLERGLDTEVGTRGVALSGGERQRLAIARALLRRPGVLLLDEATAQLDARNETALREAVDRAALGCTVILIAHRLSTVTDAERIVVLEQGRVRASGTHAELVRGDDLYRELATTQLLAGEAGASGRADAPGEAMPAR